MKQAFIPFALPEIGQEEIDEVADTLRSGWLTTGPKSARFEKAFAEMVGAPHALAVNSGTAGFHLALEAAGVGPGGKVITSVYTFTASAEVIRYLGADPVFVDINPETFNLDPAGIEEYLSCVGDGDGVKATQNSPRPFWVTSFPFRFRPKAQDALLSRSCAPLPISAQGRFG